MENEVSNAVVERMEFTPSMLSTPNTPNTESYENDEKMYSWIFNAASNGGIPREAFTDMKDHSASIAPLIGSIAGKLHDYMSCWPEGWRIVVSGGDEQKRSRVANWLACLALIHKSTYECCDNTLVRQLHMSTMAPYMSDKSIGAHGAGWQVQVAKIKAPRVLIMPEISPYAVPLDRFGGSVLSTALNQRRDAGKCTIITVATDEVIDRACLGEEMHNAIYGGDQRRNAIGVRIQEIA
jgi:hypothetical protein